MCGHLLTLSQTAMRVFCFPCAEGPEHSGEGRGKWSYMSTWGSESKWKTKEQIQIVKELILRRLWDLEQKQACSSGLVGKEGHKIERGPFLPELA